MNHAKVKPAADSWTPIAKGLTLVALVSVLRFALLIAAAIAGLVFGVLAVLAALAALIS